MNVLSLFDGMSCGMLALERTGIKVDNYYASEIDKWAIKISEKNYPNIHRLGDITQWKTWDLPKIDLIIGGSPCQGFSFAGKQLAFEDPRSKLFFEFLEIFRCIRCYNPQVKFLLENVKMKQQTKDAISELFGCEPILINSALVSGQNRNRLYWTNIPNITQPQDKGILLRDILEPDPAHPTIMSDSFVARQQGRKCLVDDFDKKAVNLSAMEYVKNGRQGDYIQVADMVINQGKECKTPNIDKSHCLLARDYKGFGNQDMTGVRLSEKEMSYMMRSESKTEDRPRILRAKGEDEKSNTITSSIHKGVPHGVIKCGAMRGRYQEDGSTAQQLEIRKDEKTNSLTTVQKDNYVVSCSRGEDATDINGHDILKRTYLPDGKSPTLHSCGGGNTHAKVQLKPKDDDGCVREYHYRKLTPVECERLQTIPDNYTDGVSNTQRYKMIGNGWTVDVIAHIFNHLEEQHD